ncbi:Uncharacterised protein [Vibrio cholerae]|nr:Uncharacterised protein [Vibrio cholerae]
MPFQSANKGNRGMTCRYQPHCGLVMDYARKHLFPS